MSRNFTLQSKSTLGLTSSANTWTNKQSIILSTSTDRALYLGTASSTFTLGTGTISVTNRTVTGTGTSFLTELKVGDTIGRTSITYGQSVVVQIISDTSCYVSNIAISGFSGINFRIYKSAFTSDNTTGKGFGIVGQNLGSAMNGGMVVDADGFYIANTLNRAMGLIVESVASDGRMKIRSSDTTTSYIQFWHGNSGVELVNCTVTGGLNLGATTKIGSASDGGNDNRIMIERSGTGVGQTEYFYTQTYATNGAQPKLYLSCNGYEFYTRSTTWNAYTSGLKTLEMLSTGEWIVTSQNTATVPLTIKAKASQTAALTQWEYDTSNYANIKVSSTGGVTLDGAGSASSFTFNKAIINTLPARLKGYTVATLPTGTIGDICYCTDLLLPAFLTVAVGGGAVAGPVFYNGTQWVT